MRDHELLEKIRSIHEASMNSPLCTAALLSCMAEILRQQSSVHDSPVTRSLQRSVTRLKALEFLALNPYILCGQRTGHFGGQNKIRKDYIYVILLQLWMI